MSDPIMQSFGAELSRIATELKSCAVWPSPATGLAIHLLGLGGNEGVVSEIVEVSLPGGPLDTAPSIAAAGYAIAMLAPGQEYEARWQLALSRLMKQEPFPRDRQTFAYRPAELVGIGLGINSISTDQRRFSEWYQDVIRQLPAKTPPMGPWTCLLYHYAASLAGATWPFAVSTQLSECDIPELSLLVVLLNQGHLSDVGDIDRGKLHRDLLQRAVVSSPKMSAPEKLAAAYAGLSLSLHASIPVSSPSETLLNFQPPSKSTVMKKQILILSANPKGTTQLALDEECRQIEQKIRAAEHRDSLDLVTTWAVRPEDLLQYLNQHRPHVVHFSGHGTPADEIVLLDKDRNPRPVSAAALKQLFTTLKDNIRIVVLNACFSRPQAEAITEVIDCAVGMNKSIGDAAAIVFAAAFYQALGFGRSVEVAFESGKTALMLEGIPEDQTPELLCRRGIDPATVYLIESHAP